MKLYEYEGLELFRKEDIPCLDFSLASNPREAVELAESIGFPVVMKVQVFKRRKVSGRRCENRQFRI